MSYYYRFLWNDENTQHVVDHGITAEEFEQAVLRAKPSAVRKSRSSARLIVISYTDVGRRICCVYEDIDSITCYPVTAYEV